MHKMKVLTALLALFAVHAVLFSPQSALAQSDAAKRPLSGLAAPSGDRAQAAARATPAAEPAGLGARLWMWVLEGQREMTGAMTSAVRQLKTGDAVGSAMALAAVSFLYGILHAVGPGHGKFVISSYALANEKTMRRGIVLSFMAALVQAVSAIAIVGVLAMLFKATSLQIRALEAHLETASWGLIALFGAWLLYRQIHALRATAGPDGHGHSHAHAHGPHHDHDGHHHPHGAHGHHHHASDPHHHHHHDEEAACAACGHAHVATPDQLQGEWSWGKAWSLALSIGIRPCTGALGVLLFALSLGLFWAGVFATFAMALGTAITVSVLAALAVGSRQLATRLAGPEGPWAGRIATAAGLTGAALVLVMGVTFCIASLSGPTPL
jgi:ABC-type nickel/cobalt efflux system permease component RcnA